MADREFPHGLTPFYTVGFSPSFTKFGIVSDRSNIWERFSCFSSLNNPNDLRPNC